MNLTPHDEERIRRALGVLVDTTPPGREFDELTDPRATPATYRRRRGAVVGGAGRGDPVPLVETDVKRRRPVVAALVAGFFVLAVGTITVLVVGPDTDQVAMSTTTPGDLSTTTLDATTSPPTSGPGNATTVPDLPPPEVDNPYLVSLLSLPACPQGGELAEWMVEIMRSSGSLGSGEFESASLREAMAATPVLRGTEATCASAGSMGEVWGWELRGSDGGLFARGVSRPDNGTVDDSPYSQSSDYYFQDSMGSGQSFTGWVLDQLIEGNINLVGLSDSASFRFVLIEVPGEAPRTSVEEGGLWLARLSLAELAPVGRGYDMSTPTKLPAGYVRCTGVYWRPGESLDALGWVVDFCTDPHNVIRVGQYHVSASPPDAQPTEIDGLPATNWTDPDGNRLVEVEILGYGFFVRIEAPAALTFETLHETLASAPGLDPRYFSPSDGIGDLRDQFGEEWLASSLEAAGAEQVVFTNGLGVPPEGALKAEMTLDSGMRLEGYFWVLDPGTASDVPWDLNQVITVGNVDLFMVRAPQVDGVIRPASQAMAYCGGVAFNIIGTSSRPESVDVDQPFDPIVDLVKTLIDHLDC